MPDRVMCNANSVLRFRGDCQGSVPYDAPVSLCVKHLREVYKYVYQSLQIAPMAFASGKSFDQVMTEALGHPVMTSGDVQLPDREHDRPQAPVVYYVRNQQRVKIGWTSNLKQRLVAIHHDEVLAVEPGDVRLEQLRHKQFADARVSRRGEWFHMDPELMSHIEMLRKHYADRQVA